MTSRPVQLVCFDLGGVVVKTRRTWEDACAAASLEIPGKLSADLGTSTCDLDELHQTGGISDAQYLDRLRVLTGNGWTALEVARVHAAWLDGEFEGMEEIIGRLGRAGIETACLSNTNALHWAILEAGARPASPRSLPVSHGRYTAFGMLRHRHASHVLGLAKPSPEIFREFERRTGFLAETILFFDDLEPNVVAARSLGWRASRIDPSRDPAPQVEAALKKHDVALPPPDDVIPERTEAP